MSSITTLELALTRSWYLSRSSLLKSERLYSERRSSLVDLTFFILESPAEIEEIAQGQLPAGKEIGSEDLIARQGCVHEVLLPLEFQNLHSLGLRVNEPILRHARLCIDRQLGGAIIRCGGR